MTQPDSSHSESADFYIGCALKEYLDGLIGAAEFEQAVADSLRGDPPPRYGLSIEHGGMRPLRTRRVMGVDQPDFGPALGECPW